MNGREALAARLCRMSGANEQSPTQRRDAGDYMAGVPTVQDLADAILADGAVFLPHGLDVERLARAIERHAAGHKTHSRTHVRASCSQAIAREYATIDNEKETS